MRGFHGSIYAANRCAHNLYEFIRLKALIGKSAEDKVRISV